MFSLALTAGLTSQKLRQCVSRGGPFVQTNTAACCRAIFLERMIHYHPRGRGDDKLCLGLPNKMTRLLSAKIGNALHTLNVEFSSMIADKLHGVFQLDFFSYGDGSRDQGGGLLTSTRSTSINHHDATSCGKFRCKFIQTCVIL